MQDITVEDMQQMQMDTYSYYGEVLLPSLLEWVQTDSLSSQEMEIYNLMAEWNYHMDADMIAPSVFRSWRGHFYRSIFYDEYESTPAMLRYPARDRFAEVIKNEPDWPFIDDVETDEVETRQERATHSFKTAISELSDEHGEFSENWKWGYVIDNDINHLAFIPGMGEQDLFSSGSSEAINATRGTHGPSWRMVVEVGPEVRGYGVYPGGQSGNPGSKSYTEFIETWRTGNLFELKFLREKPDLSESFPLMITME